MTDAERIAALREGAEQAKAAHLALVYTHQDVISQAQRAQVEIASAYSVRLSAEDRLKKAINPPKPRCTWQSVARALKEAGFQQIITSMAPQSYWGRHGFTVEQSSPSEVNIYYHVDGTAMIPGIQNIQSTLARDAERSRFGVEKMLSMIQALKQAGFTVEQHPGYGHYQIVTKP